MHRKASVSTPRAEWVCILPQLASCLVHHPASHGENSAQLDTSVLLQQALINVLVANVYDSLVAERKLTQSMLVTSKQGCSHP